MRVTVGLPFVGNALFLEDAIKSVFLQSHEDWELILLSDDGDQDCLDVARLASEDYRVTLIEGRHRVGLAGRLNEITKATSSELLFRMDSDDLMHPRRIESQHARLRESDEDVIASRAFAIDTDGTFVGQYREGPLPSPPIRSLRSNLLTHPTVAGRTDWFARHEYDSSYLRAEDKNLWLRTMNESRFWKSDECLLFYRLRMPTPSKIKIASSNADRRTVLAEGPRVAGRGATYAYVVESLVKDGIYIGLSAFRGASIIDSRKIVGVSPNVSASARAWIEKVRVQRLEDLIRSTGSKAASRPSDGIGP